MPVILASAPGKIILLGEHAVVYDRPALAIPVYQVQAKAIISADPTAPQGRIMVEAPEIKLRADLSVLPADHPLVLAIQGVREALKVTRLPSFHLRITSTIPVAAGLGSGAAVSAAVVRAVSSFLGSPLPDTQVNDLVYRVEQRLHGTPSGIDNTVVTYARPIFFQRSRGFEQFQVHDLLTFVIADTGVQSPTRQAVGDVRQQWEQDKLAYEMIFDQIGKIVLQARQIIENGPADRLGHLLDENHALLQKIGVSSPALDRLVEAARAGGALGAKLSGGGRGGNMIALVKPEQANQVAEALQSAGAIRTIITQLKPGGS